MTRCLGSGRRLGWRPVLDRDRSGGRAPVSIEGLGGHAIQITLPRFDVLVGPFETALLPKAGLVVEIEAADLDERRGARRALDHEAAEIVHALSAPVAEGAEP